jgi:outer membrane protein assembly factor BamB
MTISQNEKLTLQKPLRLWPGVVLVIIQLLLRFGLPLVWAEGAVYGVLGGFVCAIAIVIWWVFFSRAPWVERLGALILMAAAIFVTRRFLVHESILGGAMGMLYYILSIPLLGILFVAWAVFTRNFSIGVRRVTMVAIIFLACGVWTLIRTGGFSGEFENDFAWRWSETPEERLLEHELVVVPPLRSVKTPVIPAPAKTSEVPVVSQTVDNTTTQTAPAQVETKIEWPGFRGPARDDIIHGVRVGTDWTTTPPRELWRRSIGPGWSSFAVQGDHIYTQEQRGDSEVVACYSKSTGRPVWRHGDSTRFWESNAGAGPRGTPTLHNGRVYAFGATGILNALNAADGTVVWSRNAATDVAKKIPGWGFASSPLVVDEEVIIAVAGQLAAYDLATGKPRWFGPKGGSDYSSPHLSMIHGVPQILLMSSPGVTSFAPDGKVLWQYALPSATRITQPALDAAGDLVVSEGEGHGMRRIAVANGAHGWSVKERWTTIGLKPYFSDFVIHDGHVFGFDGAYISCIDLKNGERKWKGGHYGAGQLILLADQDLLLVQSEKGELALVEANPDQFKELAQFKAIEGKTWNHPVLVGNVLLVRNGEEMAAFRLPGAGK